MTKKVNAAVCAAMQEGRIYKLPSGRLVAIHYGEAYIQQVPKPR